jgi:hypothetical protein
MLKFLNTFNYSSLKYLVITISIIKYLFNLRIKNVKNLSI